jgi:hypothetical protein
MGTRTRRQGRRAPSGAGCALFCCFPAQSTEDSFALAVVHGRHEEVHQLLLKDLELLLKRSVTKRKLAWHVAAKNGDVPVLEALVDAVLNGRDAAKLHASMHRSPGAEDLDPEDRGVLLNAFLRDRCHGGLTPLMLAARGGHLEAVAYLLNLGEASCMVAWTHGANRLERMHASRGGSAHGWQTPLAGRHQPPSPHAIPCRRGLLAAGQHWAHGPAPRCQAGPAACGPGAIDQRAAAATTKRPQLRLDEVGEGGYL